MLKKTPVQYYEVELLCDYCEEPMASTGFAYQTNPPQFPHVCPNGHEIVVAQIYPSVQYEKIEIFEMELND